MCLKVFAPDAKLPIWAVILLYLTIVSYLEAVAWPILFYIVVTTFNLYDFLSLNFIFISSNAVSLVFLYISGIILLAGCFTGNGLRVLFDNWPDYYKFEKKLTTRYAYEVVTNRNKFIGFFLIYIAFCILLIFIIASVGSDRLDTIIIDGPKDPTDPRYILLSSGNFAEYAAKYVDFWPFTKNQLGFRVGVLMGFCFSIGYHFLITYPLLLGIQVHIWKMDIEDIDIDDVD